MMGTVQRFGGHVTAALLGQVTIAAAIDARAERREQVGGQQRIASRIEAAVPGEQLPRAGIPSGPPGPGEPGRQVRTHPRRRDQPCQGARQRDSAGQRSEGSTAPEARIGRRRPLNGRTHG